MEIYKAKIPRSIFYLLFTFSGFAGLIYESIWSHYLKLFLGHAAYAQTLVLAIFMGGMAVGASICSAYTGRLKNLLLGYAAAELAIGILALVFHGVFVGTIAFAYDTLFPVLATGVSIDIAKWLIAGLLILPQSILLGTTFPLMTAGVMRIYPQTPGSSLSILYFTNSFGAAVGVLASGFYLIEAVGMPGTLLTAGLMNVTLALVVWALCRSPENRLPAGTIVVDAGPGTPETYGRDKSPAADRRLLNLLLGASLVTGAASFCYEIGWIRMLSMVLGSSTHAFEIMLSAFILGLAFGGLWIKRRIDRYRNVMTVLAIALVAKGVLALATLPVYGLTFEAMRLTFGSLTRTDFSYTVFNLISHLISLSVMFPAAFCAGMSLPLITFALLGNGHGESSIGKVYAWNTFGAIVGVLFAVHVGMPQFGLQRLIEIAAVADIVVAIVLLAGLPGSNNKPALAFSAIAGAVAVVCSLLFVEFDTLKMASGVYRTGTLWSRANTELIFHRDGKTATIDVIRRGSVMSVITNGKPDASLGASGGFPSADEHTMVLLAALPLAFRPEARTVANIGFGSGMTTHALLGSTTVQSVDTIEIEPAIVEGARALGPQVGRAFTDPRSVIHIDDAKSFFAGRDTKYDLIISEPSNPWVSGVSSLFSGEFYGQIRRHLNNDGMLVQWIQLYEIDIDLIASILKALGAHFADYAAYTSDAGDLIVMAVPHGTVPPMTDAPFRSPMLKKQIARLGIDDSRQLEMRLVGSKKNLDVLVRSYGVPANSDYFPVVDLRASKSRFLNLSATDLGELGAAPVPIVDMLEGADFRGLGATPPQEVIFAPRVYMAAFARASRDYLVDGGPASPMLKDDWRLKSTFLADRLLRCIDTEKDTLWFEPLFIFAQPISTQLTAAESTKVWEMFENAKCYRGLPAPYREWIALFKATGNRDANAMAEHAEKLFEVNAARDIPQKQYLLMAGMLGHLAANRKAAALALWTRRAGDALVTGGKIPLPIRYLASLALKDSENAAVPR